MKVLLVNTNQADRYMGRMSVRPLPIGLAFVAAHVDENRHTLKVLDLMFSDDPCGDVRRVVQEFSPDVVGLSMRNLDNGSSLNTVWHLPGVKQVVDEVRAGCNAKIVCGGTAFSILPEACMEYLNADAGLIGHAIDTFGVLVDRLDSGESLGDVPGIVYRDNGEIKINSDNNVSELHNPPRLDLMDIARYNKAGFGVGVVTKLAPTYYEKDGDNSWSDEANWNIRPVSQVMDEIGSLRKNHNINKVFFIDSGFNAPIDYAKNLCKTIIDEGAKVRWNTYVRTGDNDEELYDLMKRSGCSLALIAANGGHDDNNDMALSDHLDRVVKMAEMCKSADLPYLMNLGFGEPGETDESVDLKVDMLKKTAPAIAMLKVSNRVLPGTSLSKQLIEQGAIKSESDLLKPTFFTEPTVRDGLVSKIENVISGIPRWNIL